ncbi:MAG: Coenzyme F420 hydrogenase/dehydrogenase, beta subunit C-terminal domain [Cetobacterium sp.]
MSCFKYKKIKKNPKAYACYNKNEVIRRASSSGEIFSLLAEKVLKNNGIVFGAKFSKEFDVVHGYIATIDRISEFRGVKYVQSIIGDTYIQVKLFLEDNKQVLFSGTPCQISGLKRYLNKDYKNLITLDLICHGLPSPKAWIKYKKEVSKEYKIKNIRFREKENGWKSYSLVFNFHNGLEKRRLGKENTYIRGFIGIFI